ncbi:MAG: (2Fe-2S)-binding protein [Chloroflexota bacterium]
MPDLSLTVNGRTVRVRSGFMVAAAVALAGEDAYRHSVRGEARGPLCGMGICFECRVTIDGHEHRLSCQTPCEDGMKVVAG